MYLEKKTPCYINPMNNNYFSAAYIEHLKTSYPYRSYYGKANNECQHGGAVFWYEERKNQFAQRLHIVRATRKGRLNSHLLTIPLNH